MITVAMTQMATERAAPAADRATAAAGRTVMWNGSASLPYRQVYRHVYGHVCRRVHTCGRRVNPRMDMYIDVHIDVWIGNVDTRVDRKCLRTCVWTWMGHGGMTAASFADTNTATRRTITT